MDDIHQIEKELTEVKLRLNATNKQMDELQAIVKAFYELAADVKVMVNEMTNMKSDINDIKVKVDNYEHAPSKLVNTVKTTIVTTIVGALVAALVALVIK